MVRFFVSNLSLKKNSKILDMELVLRTITGTLEDAFGEPMANAKIVFIVKRAIGANGVTVPALRREVLTDDNGEFSIGLYTFDEATVPYECLLPSKESFSFNLAAGDPITLETLRQIAVAESENSQGFLEELIREIIETEGGGASGPAGGVLSGAYPNPGFAVNMVEQSELDAHTSNTNNPHAVTKTQIGLGNVDNTSDATKNAATATLINKTISGANNTLTNIPQSSVTNLVADLAAKQATFVSGTNIKTINGESVLGSGNIEIVGGGLAPSSAIVGQQTWALKIDARTGTNQNVKCGKFWDTANPIPGNQYFEMLGKFTGLGQYFADDSVGGRHAGILLGVENTGKLTGNTWVDSGSGAVAHTYQSGIPITLNDLGTVARLHLADRLFLFWKGVMVGVKEFPSGVRHFNDASADGHLHFGAFDHQGALFHAVFARIMEDGIPLNLLTATYYPKMSVANDLTTQIDGTTIREFSGAWDFTNPYNTHVIPDLSNGKEVFSGTGKMKHNAFLSNGVANSLFRRNQSVDNGQKPVYEQILFGQSPFTKTPPSAPAGALVYDSHTRADVTGQWGGLIAGAGAGQVGGAWIGADCGIISEHLFLSTLYSPVYKLSPVDDYEVTYSRANSPFLRASNHYESYFPKMIDDDNSVRLQFSPFGGLNLIDQTNRYSGGTAIGGGFSVPMSWVDLRVRFVGTQMEIFLDNVLITTQTIPSRFNGARRAGLMETDTLLRKLKSVLIKAS